MNRVLHVSRVAVLLALLVGGSTGAQSIAPAWTQWRGAARDGVARLDVAAAWPASLTRRWELIIGSGHSSPVMSGDRVVVHSRQGESEITRALDLKTGKELWRSDYAAPYMMNPAARAHGPGPKSTPVIADGRVFTFGISGILSAHDLASGKVLWRSPAPPSPPEFGTAMSPVVSGSHVIVHLGGMDKGALTAFDAATGAVRWRWPDDGPAYASPVIAQIDGTRQLVTQTENAVIGVDAADGQLLWRVAFKTPFDQNSVTPVVAGDMVIYSGLDQGTNAVRVARTGATWRAEPLWKNDQVSMYMSSPVVVNGRLYGLSHRNRGQFFAVDVATGRTLWTSPGREGENASVIATGPFVLFSTTNAELVVMRAASDRLEEVRRYTIADSAVWAHPAISGRTILVKDADKLICWGL